MCRAARHIRKLRSVKDVLDEIMTHLRHEHGDRGFAHGIYETNGTIVTGGSSLFARLLYKSQAGDGPVFRECGGFLTQRFRRSLAI